MERRKFLKAIGGLSIIGAASTGAVGASGKGEIPNDKVDTTDVSFFKSNPNNATNVPKGNWIKHIFGWVDIDGTGSEKEDVERWLDAVELDVFIDGEEIENPNQYWGDVQKTNGEGDSSGNWKVWWEYDSPPKPPGLYDFTVVFNYPDGFEDPASPEEKEEEEMKEDDTYADIPKGHTVVRTGYYRVL